MKGNFINVLCMIFLDLIKIEIKNILRLIEYKLKSYHMRNYIFKKIIWAVEADTKQS